MNHNLLKTLAAATLAMGLGFTPAVRGAVIVSTDFTGRTVAGNTAGNIPYTTHGVQNPGDLTAVEASTSDAGGTELAGLFDNSATTGFFAPNLNTYNQDYWSVSVPLTLTTGSLTIQQVVLDGAMFSDGGGAQTGTTRSTTFTISFIGSVSGTIASQSGTANDGAGWSLTYDFTNAGAIPGVTLAAGQTYQMLIAVTDSTGSGHNDGLDGFEVSGLLVPEPASIAMIGLSTIVMLGRQRRR